MFTSVDIIKTTELGLLEPILLIASALIIFGFFQKRVGWFNFVNIRQRSYLVNKYERNPGKNYSGYPEPVIVKTRNGKKRVIIYREITWVDNKSFKLDINGIIRGESKPGELGFPYKIQKDQTLMQDADQRNRDIERDKN